MKRIRRAIAQHRETCAMGRMIRDVKKYAKANSAKVPVQHIALATAKLEELYASARFHSNLNFVYSRYVKLERKKNIFSNVFFPSLLSYFSIDFFLHALPTVFEELTEAANILEMFVLALYLWAISDVNMRIHTFMVYLQIFGALFVLIWGICKLCRFVITSVSRTAEETITENEMTILRNILTKNRILR